MITELKRFIVTVDTGSLTKASTILYITQPALSASLNRLETELGIKLFNRIGKHLELTEQGKSVYQAGLAILKLWENTKNIKSSEPKVTYKIGLFDNAALKLSAYFQQQLKAPGFKFDITIDRSHVLLQGVQNGVLDLCISIIQPNFVFNSSVVMLKKTTERLIPVSGKKWSGKINQAPLILYNKGSATRSYIDETFLKLGLKTSVIVESTDPTFMKQLAIGNCGVALLPENFIADDLKAKRLIVQKTNIKFVREIGIFINKGSAINQTDQVVQEIIKNFN